MAGKRVVLLLFEGHGDVVDAPGSVGGHSRLVVQGREHRAKKRLRETVDGLVVVLDNAAKRPSGSVLHSGQLVLTGSEGAERKGERVPW